MKLTKLEPQFIRYESKVETYEVVIGNPATWRERGCPTKEVTGPREYMHHVETFAEAQGVYFLCPKCFRENGGPKGTHSVYVTFEGRGVDPAHGAQNKQGPVRWGAGGSGYDDLTITPSILVIGGCGWHGFITKGEATE